MRLVDFGDTLPASLTAGLPETLKGKLFKNGSPASRGATVRVLDKISVTGADGSFEFAGLPSGTHFVFVPVTAGAESFQMQTSDSTNAAEISDTVYTLWKISRTGTSIRSWERSGAEAGGLKLGFRARRRQLRFPSFRDTAAVIISDGAIPQSLYAKFDVDSLSLTGVLRSSVYARRRLR